MHQRQIGAVRAGPQRHLERVEDEGGAHVAGELPADDAAGERVEHEAEEHGPLPAAQIGEVRHPQRVRSLCGELAVDKIRPPRRERIRRGCPPRLPTPLRPGQALDAHQPRNLITAGVLAGTLQRLPHPAISIGAVVGPVHVADPAGEPPMPLSACGVLRMVTLIVGRHRDAQRPADGLDPVAIAYLIDERAHDGRFGSSSCAKNTLASFRIVFARRELEVLATQPLELLLLTRRQPLPLTGVNLRPTDVLTQRLRPDPQVLGDVRDRPLTLQREPHTAVQKLLRILALTWHDRRVSSPEDRILASEPPSRPDQLKLV
jgi:hypothetical protein